MDLSTFVSETIREIVEGVKHAQEQLEVTGAKINPITVFMRENAQDRILERGTYRLIQEVEFDVAITVADEQVSEGGITKQLAIAYGANEDSIRSSKASLSRVRFTVPILLPPNPEAIPAESADATASASLKVTTREVGQVAILARPNELPSSLRKW